jgi:spermidine/putrescine transport system substrate-binding protein
MASNNKNSVLTPSRRDVLRYGGAAALSMPFVSRAWAQTVEINMLAWYGHGEPDIVGEFEAANNVKFKPKYYAGGDNMLGLIAQSPPGTYDIILSDARVRAAAQCGRLYRGAERRRLQFRRHAA